MSITISTLNQKRWTEIHTCPLFWAARHIVKIKNIMCECIHAWFPITPTVGPANREVPESAIAAQPSAQNPEK